MPLMSRSNILLVLTIIGVSMLGCRKYETISTETNTTTITTNTTTTTTTTNNVTNNYYYGSTNTQSSKTNYKYLFIGHSYYGDGTMDPRITPMLDRDVYDQFWLGGDMCGETTKSYSTIEYLDSLFDLGSPYTHWSVGNHDTRNGNIHWITNKTQRPTFYTTTFNGICLLVLNTNFRTPQNTYDEVQSNAQYEMIKQVCDTIRDVSHLIVMSHGALWSRTDGMSSLTNLANADHSYYWLNFNPNLTYDTGVYPLLVNVVNRGIKVIHVSGDFGQYSTGYDEVSDDGIQYLGSGVTSEIPWSEQFPTVNLLDMVLVFNHNVETQTITWDFEVVQ